jgi:hypothetical protein
MNNIPIPEPFVVPEFLPPEIYSKVYEIVDSLVEKNTHETGDPYSEPFVKAGSNGFVILFEPFEDDVYDWLQQEFTDLVGQPVRRPNILFARYTKKSGFTPRLLPHTDRVMKYPSVTMTVELDATLPWDIYVEEEKFQMGRNQAVFFSGSHQMHYRPYPTFGKDDYYDILLVHSTLDLPDQEELTDEHFDKMDMLSGEYIQRKYELFEGGLDERPRN